MKQLIIVLTFFLITTPLLGEIGVQPQAQKQANRLEFKSFLPDSLADNDTKILMYPGLRRDYEYKNGVVIIPDPENIELNPGGIIAADPTVDLGMIYPLKTRMRIMLQKEGKLKRLPKDFKFRFPESDDDKTNEKKEDTEENDHKE